MAEANFMAPVKLLDAELDSVAGGQSGENIQTGLVNIKNINNNNRVRISENSYSNNDFTYVIDVLGITLARA